MNPLPGIVLFSLIETLTVVLWAKVLGLGKDLSLSTQLVAIAVLAIGYVIEHIVAFNVGKGRPFFSAPKP